LWTGLFKAPSASFDNFTRNVKTNGAMACGSPCELALKQGRMHFPAASNTFLAFLEIAGFIEVKASSKP
jgi:hypothetical protein